MQLPEYVSDVINTLEKNGYSAYAVGGCVRDTIMNIPPSDYDVASSALPADIMRIFKKSLPTGIKYGTVTVISQGHAVEVTTFRTDGKYHDGRRPDGVNFASDISADLSRRDFTINAMAASQNGEIIDPFGGREDIASGLIRCVGDPKVRFAEDYLRIMRAFRFASTLNFDIEKDTLSAALCLARKVGSVSAERVFAEFIKTVTGKKPSVLSPLIAANGLVLFGIPGKNNDISRLDSHACKVCREAAFAAFCHVCGADTGEVCSRLKADSVLRRISKKMSKIISAPPQSRADLKRSLADMGEKFTRDALYMAGAVNGADFSSLFAEIDDIIRRKEAYSADMLEIKGGDIAPFVARREDTGKILKEIMEYIISNPDKNKKGHLIKYAAQLAEKHGRESAD